MNNNKVSDERDWVRIRFYYRIVIYWVQKKALSEEYGEQLGYVINSFFHCLISFANKFSFVNNIVLLFDCKNEQNSLGNGMGLGFRDFIGC